MTCNQPIFQDRTFLHKKTTTFFPLTFVAESESDNQSEILVNNELGKISKKKSKSELFQIGPDLPPPLLKSEPQFLKKKKTFLSF